MVPTAGAFGPIAVVEIGGTFLVGPALRIQTGDPAELDRLAAALTSAADSLRVATSEVSR
jgi:hypothetical protein